MTRYTKNAHGHYHIHGKNYEMLEGSRAQVYHGTAYKTSGGLKKPEILMNKNGRIVSKKKHTTAKKEKRLVKAGYGTKKGKFGFVKIGQSNAWRENGCISSYGLGHRCSHISIWCRWWFQTQTQRRGRQSSSSYSSTHVR